MPRRGGHPCYGRQVFCRRGQRCSSTSSVTTAADSGSRTCTSAPPLPRLPFVRPIDGFCCGRERREHRALGGAGHQRHQSPAGRGTNPRSSEVCLSLLRVPAASRHAHPKHCSAAARMVLCGADVCAAGACRFLPGELQVPFWSPFGDERRTALSEGDDSSDVRRLLCHPVCRGQHCIAQGIAAAGGAAACGVQRMPITSASGDFRGGTTRNGGR